MINLKKDVMKTKFYLIAVFLLCLTKINSQTILNETFTGSSLPAGWSISSTAENPVEKWTFYSDYDDIEVYESKTVAQNEWVYLPSINLQTYSEMFFSFSLWMYNKTSFFKNKSCRSAVVISIDNGSTWAEVWNTDSLNADEFAGEALFFRFWSINLSAYCGAGKPAIKIAFKYTSNKTFNDTINSFAAIVRANISTSPIVSLSKLSKQVINWHPISNYNGTYDLYYGPLGSTTSKSGGKLITGLTGSSFAFPENYCQYTAFIRTNNGALGEWVELNFQNTVGNLIAEKASTSSNISWTGDSDLYDLEYGLGNFTVGSGTRISNISAKNYNINGLSPNTSYKVFLKASCNAANWSSTNFTTSFLSAAEASAIKLNIYPNPTSDFLNFSEKIENLLILDNAGRLIKSVKNSTEIIDVSKLSKGIYTISGYVNGKKVIRKIIKK